MSYQASIERAREELKAARQGIRNELRDYPTPVAGCDAQYTHLVGLESSVSRSIQALESPDFVATPRQLEPEDLAAAGSAAPTGSGGAAARKPRPDSGANPATPASSRS